MTYVDSAPQTPDEPERGKEAKKPTARMRRYWREIEAYNKAAEEWKIQGETIVKLTSLKLEEQTVQSLPKLKSTVDQCD